MKPLPATQQYLPSTLRLCAAPQMAILTSLQVTLRMTAPCLDIQHPDLGADDQARHPDDVVAQLIIDRCRELSELITLYRQLALSASDPPATDDSDSPF